MSDVGQIDRFGHHQPVVAAGGAEPVQIVVLSKDENSAGTGDVLFGLLPQVHLAFVPSSPHTTRRLRLAAVYAAGRRIQVTH